MSLGYSNLLPVYILPRLKPLQQEHCQQHASFVKHFAFQMSPVTAATVVRCLFHHFHHVHLKSNSSTLQIISNLTIFSQIYDSITAHWHLPPLQQKWLLLLAVAHTHSGFMTKFTTEQGRCIHLMAQHQATVNFMSLRVNKLLRQDCNEGKMNSAAETS